MHDQTSFRATAIYTRKAQELASTIGIDLDPPLAKSIIDKIKAGQVVWYGTKDDTGCQSFFINLANQRVRVVLDADQSRIITMGAREFASPAAIAMANNVKMTLNLAMATLILDRVRAGDCVETDGGRGTSATCHIEFMDYGHLSILYNRDTGNIMGLCRVKAEDAPARAEPGPRIVSQHPKATKHASKRAVQRFGLELTPERTEKILDSIRRKQWIDCFPPRKHGSATALMEIDDGVQACVVYDAHTMSLITVTPIDRFQATTKRREMFQARQKELKKTHSRNMRMMKDDG